MLAGENGQQSCVGFATQANCPYCLRLTEQSENKVIISDFMQTTSGGRARSQATFTLEHGVFPATGSSQAVVFFDWPSAYSAVERSNTDSFAIAALPFCLQTGERLRIEKPISSTLLLNLLEVSEVYRLYFPKTVYPVEIECDVRPRENRVALGTGSFFSGGIDSIYNVAEMRRLSTSHGLDMVTDLWLVRGTDIRLTDSQLWDDSHHRLQKAVGEEFRFADIATNLRDVHSGLVPWTDTGFSSILGAIAKLFAEQCDVALIGSTLSYAEQIPHASSPLIDPLWSCDRQTVRHFTSRVSRNEKVAVASDYAPDLMAEVRVCYENRDGKYNCGVCEKCLRTQLALVCHGRDTDLNQFSDVITIPNMLRIELPCDPKKRYTWLFWRELSTLARETGNFDFANACDAMLRKNRMACPLRRLKALVRVLLPKFALGRFLLTTRHQLRRL